MYSFVHLFVDEGNNPMEKLGQILRGLIRFVIGLVQVAQKGTVEIPDVQLFGDFGGFKCICLHFLTK